jgi:hypothetical protein
VRLLVHHPSSIMAASPRFEEFWLSRFERPRTVSPRGPGASPRCAPGASQYGACCSSMDDSATIEASKLYPGRVVDSAIARKERLATHVPSRPAHLEDPETRRLQENEIKAQFYQSTLKPKGTFGGSSWVPMPSSLSTYTVRAPCLEPPQWQRPRGRLEQRHSSTFFLPMQLLSL